MFSSKTLTMEHECKNTAFMPSINVRYKRKYQNDMNKFANQLTLNKRNCVLGTEKHVSFL